MSGEAVERQPTFVDGIGPPLEQLAEDYKGSSAALGDQVVNDVLHLIHEVFRLNVRVANFERYVEREIEPKFLARAEQAEARLERERKARHAAENLNADEVLKKRTNLEALIQSLEVSVKQAEAREQALGEALSEYADHQSWRCAYRSRYGECRCGLDKTMESLGLPIVEVIDPEEPHAD